MPHSLIGAFGGPHGYSRLPVNPECDEELLKLLPEFKRISLSQLKYLFSLRDGLLKMAAERGIDIYEDDEETLPEEIQRYWACHRARAQYSDLIAYIEACKAQQDFSRGERRLEHGCKREWMASFLLNKQAPSFLIRELWMDEGLEHEDACRVLLMPSLTPKAC
ncbi:hypothetical protein COCOBI_16-1840 [Coccomyxa sp. Obi]|nr:hypothetical protein COCOBI_16-1840 [Coccomyxa sp. Obi]